MDIDAHERLMQYYQELEMVIALLVTKYGEETEGGFRMVISEREAFELRGKLGTIEPVVINTFETPVGRYVIDVL